SSVNHLESSNSDVDICVTTLNKELENVFTLSEILQKHNMEIVECVSDAKVPIVKFWDPRLKLACDVNVNNTIVIYNTQLIKSYIEIDKRIRPLVMIIRHWARQRGLNNAVLQIPDIPLNNEVDLSFYQNIDSFKRLGNENHESI
ncbi:30532_t:CDS:2, partial [Gigaspora margarita]